MNKEELITAAETIKKYCEQHICPGCPDESEDTKCVLSNSCYDIYKFNCLGLCMQSIINDVRCSDDSA